LYIDGVLFQEEESTAWKLDKVDRTSLLLIGDRAVALSAELSLVAMYAKALTAAEVRYSLRAGPSRRLPKRGRRLRGFVPLNRTARAMRLLWPAVRVAVQPQLCPRRLSRVVQRTAIPRAIQGTTLPGSTATRRWLRTSTRVSPIRGRRHRSARRAALPAGVALRSASSSANIACLVTALRVHASAR
jgi:hypothetical protein